MVKTILPALVILAALTSCSSLKPLQSGNASASRTAAPADKKSNINFLDDINVSTGAVPAPRHEPAGKTAGPSANTNIPDNNARTGNASFYRPTIENASALQLKYAVLLNVEVELLDNNALLAHIDDWYGTRYRLGGTTRSGIDCSAFVQAVYLSAFAVPLPRTAREQYQSSHIISATELREGDLVFFNTTGGISHVGIYLQNNKFIHASSSSGVIISDMYEPYYVRRFVGAGRVEKPGASIR
ncbi:MAG: C40 family peptidase [Chitinophagaceae bacterium]